MFPEIIQIQTTSYCNKACGYCPYGEVSREQPMGIMLMHTVKKLVDEFVEKGNFLVPYLQAEPLLDTRIFKILDYIRQKSDIPMELSTNCILLNQKVRHRLAEYSNIQFILHLDSFNSKASENAKRFLTLPLQNVLIILFSGFTSRNDVENWLRYGREHEVAVKVLTACSRANNVVAIPSVTRSSGASCMGLRTRKWIHVLWDGTVILCCQDWRRTVVLGNVANHSIEDVFNSELFNRTRQYVSGINTPSSFLCRKCSFWTSQDSVNFTKKLGDWK